ncbi:hypothetical protein FRB99_003037 [Tulasnella sp. 403]|nr:hypothetical protein FRB99_003037 [Tulasnella sp. 403]
MADFVKESFDSSSLSSPSNLDAALTAFNYCVTNGAYPVANIVKSLMAHKPGIFELVMCSAGTGFDTLRQRILDDLAGALSPQNIQHYDAIQRLCAFATSLPPIIPLDRMILSRCQVIDSALRALEYLSSRDLYNAMEVVNKSRLRDEIGFQDADAKSKDLPLDHDISKLYFDIVRTLTQESQVLFDSLLVPGVAQFASSRLLKEIPVSVPPPHHTTANPGHSSNTGSDDQLAGTMLNERSSRISPEEVLLYLDTSSTSYGKWPVFVAERAILDLKNLSTNSPELFALVQPKIKELSLGCFSPANQMALLKSDYGIPLYKATLATNTHVIYQIDCGAPVVDHTGKKQESQCECTARASPEIRTRGAQRMATTPPLIFSRSDAALKFEWDVSEWGIELDESHFLGLHRILSMQKFVPFSSNFLNAIKDRDGSSFVFAMSTREDDIVRHKSSCLVLGRSGTGLVVPKAVNIVKAHGSSPYSKTTTMLFRMKALEIGAEKLGYKMRQVFVTQSRTLALKVKQYYTQLSRTSASATGSTQTDSRSTTDTGGFGLQDISDDQLDEHMTDKRLPTRFTDLADENFPLFLSFDQLCSLLEADLGLQFQPHPQYQPSGHRTGLQHALRGVRHPLVTYDYSLSNIFPSFGENARKNLDPALLYSEFVGVIKGSEISLATPTGVLDQTQYESADSKGRSAVFDRSYVYSLFQLYQKRRPPQSYDIADRTHAIVSSLKDGLPSRGKTFDFLYVDEIQDNLIVDIALLRTLCPNPHGIFFAGDTAQTISVGSAFRFNELKAALYRMELADPLVKTGVREPVKHELFQLSTNYRSHGGIVQAARFVVDLLTRFFPNSLDTLAPESAKVTGPKPMFFLNRPENDSNLRRLIQEKSTGNVEFGAEQAIIVRNDDGKRRIKDIIGETAIILSVYESKGMEFNDVLLYDFFYDSPCSTKDWEAVARDLSDPATSGSYYRPFDRYRYAIMQSELKTLYVGLTRARERVWLWDISDKGTLLKTLMLDRGLCTARGTSEEVPQVAVTSTKDQWAKQARELFTKRLYEQAAYCFFKAELPLWRDIAITYGDRQAAQKLSSTDPRRCDSFRKVADQFYSQASEAPRTQDQLMLYANAARCFVEAQEHYRAAKSFAQAQKYNDALCYYKILKSFDEALEVISSHWSEVDPGLAESIKYTAKIVFTTKQPVDAPGSVEYLEKAGRICESAEEYIAFLEDHGFTKQLVIYLDRVLHRNEVAAEVLERNSAHAEAVVQWLKVDSVAARLRAASCLLDGLRREVPYGTDYRNPTPQMVALLKLTPDRPPRNPAETELSMYRVIFLRESDKLLQMATETYPPEENIRCTLLCLDAWSSTKPLQVIETAHPKVVIPMLEGYLKYFGAIRSFIRRISRDQSLMGADEFLGFFGFTLDKQVGSAGVRLEGMALLRVLPRSFVYGAAVAERLRHPEGTPITISRNGGIVLIKKVLIEKYNEILRKIHNTALSSGAFNLYHMSAAARGVLQFDTQIRAHCSIIAVLDHVAALPGISEEQQRRTIQRIWLSKLFEICHPSTTQLGNFADIAPSRIPGFLDVVVPVTTWLEENASNFHQDLGQHLLNNVILTATLSSLLDHQPTFQRVEKRKIGQNLRPEPSPRPNKGDPIALYALAWFSRDLPSRHLRAILFIEQVVKRRVAMDVTYLIAFIEDVSAQLILNHYYHGIKPNYNGMVMPRSWFLRQIIAPPKHWELRFVNIKRIYRAMLLVGYNCRNDALMEEITKILGAIQRELPGNPLRAFEVTFANYCKSKDWSGVFGALVANPPCAPVDVLLGIWRYRQPTEPPPKAIRAVVWYEIPDLIAKVSTTGAHQSVLAVPAARNSATLFVPPFEIIRKEASVKVMQVAFRRRCSIARDSVPTKPTADNVERQKESVKILEAFYLHHQKSSTGGPPTYDAFDKLASRPLTGCSQGELHMFSVHLRGPLPHVVEFIRKTLVHITDKSTVLNDQVKDSRDGDLDNIRAQREELKLLKGNFEELLGSLVPESTIYQEPALLPLQQLVRTIPALTKKLSEFCGKVEDEDYAQGVEVMLEKSQRMVEVGETRRVEAVEPTKKKEKHPAPNMYNVGIESVDKTYARRPCRGMTNRFTWTPPSISLPAVTYSVTYSTQSAGILRYLACGTRNPLMFPQQDFPSNP